MTQAGRKLVSDGCAPNQKYFLRLEDNCIRLPITNIWLINIQIKSTDDKEYEEDVLLIH